jgi:hypothetical protein
MAFFDPKEREKCEEAISYLKEAMGSRFTRGQVCLLRSARGKVCAVLTKIKKERPL